MAYCTNKIQIMVTFVVAVVDDTMQEEFLYLVHARYEVMHAHVHAIPN